MNLRRLTGVLALLAMEGVGPAPPPPTPAQLRRIRVLEELYSHRSKSLEGLCVRSDGDADKHIRLMIVELFAHDFVATGSACTLDEARLVAERQIDALGDAGLEPWDVFEAAESPARFVEFAQNCLTAKFALGKLGVETTFAPRLLEHHAMVAAQLAFAERFRGITSAITFTAVIAGFEPPTDSPKYPWQFASDPEDSESWSYGWHVTDVVVLRAPIPCAGLQGPWTLAGAIEREAKRKAKGGQ